MSNVKEVRMKRCVRCGALTLDTAEYFYRTLSGKSSLKVCIGCCGAALQATDLRTRRYFIKVIEGLKPAIAVLRRQGRL